MALAHLKGTARILYTHPSTGATTHLLAVPLSPVRELLPSLARERHDFWSSDKRTRQTVTIDVGVEEVVCAIRFDDQPVELREMLRVALEDDVTLNYEPVTAGTSYPVKLVEIAGAGKDEVPLTPDRSRYGFGEWEVTIRLRRVDGGTLSGIFS